MNEAATTRREVRQRKGLRLVDLADATGLSQGQMSRVEREGTDSIRLAKKLSSVLDLPVEAFEKPEGQA